MNQRLQSILTGFIVALIAMCSMNIGHLQANKVPAWQKVTLPSGFVNSYFLDVFFLPSDSRYGWACGFDGNVLRTIDGGANWQGVSIQGKPFLESIHFVDSQHGFTSGPGGVFKTIDGGISWININGLVNMSQIWGCYFVDKDNGLYIGGGCVGSPQVFVKTTDGGNTWSIFESSEPETGLSDLILYDKDGLGYAVSSGVLWRTTNGGNTWSIFSDIAGPRAWAEEITHRKNSFLTPFSGDDCFGGIRDFGGANFTTDNGKTWNQFVTNKSMFGSFLLDEKRGWICGDRGEVLYTSNAGVNWTKFNCGLQDANIDDLWFISDSLGWAVGEGLYKFSFVNVPDSFIKKPVGSYCFGDSVLLSVQEGFNYVRWNVDDTFGSEVYVKKSMKVIATGVHKLSCMPVSDTVDIVFNPPVQAQLIPTKDTVLCSNDAITISVAGSYKSLKWFDSLNLSKRTFEKNTNPSGLFVDVFDSLGCKRRLKIPTITWSNTTAPKIQALGKLILCKSDSTTLSAPIGFISYRWNSGERERQINVKDPGRYFAILTDSLGCEHVSDTLTIDRIDLENFLSASIGGKAILEFDTTVIGSSTCLKLQFTNRNPYSVYELDLPYIMKNIQFSLPMSQFPIKINPLDSLTLKVCFSPDSIGIWRDTIVFRDTCSALVFPLQGYAIPFEMDDLTKCSLPLKSNVISNGHAQYFDIRPHPIQSECIISSNKTSKVHSIVFLDAYGREHMIDFEQSITKLEEISIELSLPSGIYVPLMYTSLGLFQLKPVLIIQ